MDHSKSNPLNLDDDLVYETRGPSKSAATNKKRNIKCLKFFHNNR